MNDNEFIQGYACAVSNLVDMYGPSKEAEEVLRCIRHSTVYLRKSGVDEHDIKVLRPIIKELSRKSKLKNRKG
jgi:hypothetical protein